CPHLGRPCRPSWPRAWHPWHRRKPRRAQPGKSGPGAGWFAAAGAPWFLSLAVQDAPPLHPESYSTFSVRWDKGEKGESVLGSMRISEPNGRAGKPDTNCRAARWELPLRLTWPASVDDTQTHST